MPDETLTPVIREEEFLAAIAGDGEMPDPVIRKEEFLAAIGGRVDDLADDVGDLSDAVDALEDIVPTPAVGDNGKVLTAGAGGSASWQTPSGGGNQVDLVLTETGMGQFSVSSVSATFAEICAMFAAGAPPLATIKNGDVYLYSNSAMSDGSLVVSFSFADITVDSGRGNVTISHFYLESYGDGWTVDYDSETISV